MGGASKVNNGHDPETRQRLRSRLLRLRKAAPRVRFRHEEGSPGIPWKQTTGNSRGKNLPEQTNKACPDRRTDRRLFRSLPRKGCRHRTDAHEHHPESFLRETSEI